MSEFLFVVPEGWTKVSDDVVAAHGVSAFESLCSNLAAMTDLLRSDGVITESDTVVDARVFNSELLVIKLG